MRSAAAPRRGGIFAAFAAEKLEASRRDTDAETAAASRRGGAFSSRISVGAAEDEGAPPSQATPSAPSAPRRRPPPELSAEDAKALLEDLRERCSRPDFARALGNLRGRDWGALKKRAGMAKLLSMLWKETLRQHGFSIDAHGFPDMLAAVKLHAGSLDVRIVTKEVEVLLLFQPGDLFGCARTVSSPTRRAAGQPSSPARTAGGGLAQRQSPQYEAPPRAAPPPHVPCTRDRRMFLGEAKDLLQALKGAMDTPNIQRVLADLKKKSGGDSLDRGRRILVFQEWSPILRRFEFPLTDAGFADMRAGVASFFHNSYVRSMAREVERLCHVEPGEYFVGPEPDAALQEEVEDVEAAEPTPPATVDEEEVMDVEAAESTPPARLDEQPSTKAGPVAAVPRAEGPSSVADALAAAADLLDPPAATEVAASAEAAAASEPPHGEAPADGSPAPSAAEGVPAGDAAEAAAEALDVAPTEGPSPSAAEEGAAAGDAVDAAAESCEAPPKLPAAEAGESWAPMPSAEPLEKVALPPDQPAPEPCAPEAAKSATPQPTEPHAADDPYAAADAAELRQPPGLASGVEAEAPELAAAAAAPAEHAQDAPPPVVVSKVGEQDAELHPPHVAELEEVEVVVRHGRAGDRDGGEARVRVPAKGATALEVKRALLERLGCDFASVARRLRIGEKDAGGGFRPWDDGHLLNGARELFVLGVRDSKRRPSAGAAEAVADDPKKRRFDGSEFEVVHARVIVRSAPSTSSRIAGVLVRGRRLFGEEHTVNGQPWLRLSAEMCKDLGLTTTAANAPGATPSAIALWVLVHGASVGLGDLLRRTPPAPPSAHPPDDAPPARPAAGTGAAVREAEAPPTPQKVELHLKHGQKPGEMKLSVPAAATMADVKALLVQSLGRGSVDRVQLVKKVGNTFTPYGDEETLGGRREIHVLGMALTATAPLVREAAGAEDPAEHERLDGVPAHVDEGTRIGLARQASASAERLLSEPLEYEVVRDDPPVLVREEPSVRSHSLGALDLGQHVLGYCGGGWLRLCDGGDPSVDPDLVGGWVFIGGRLANTKSRIQVRAHFSEALEVSWAGFPEMQGASYSVEWKLAKLSETQASAKPPRPPLAVTERLALLSGLPPGASVLVRVVTHLPVEGSGGDGAGEVHIFGPWDEACAGKPIPADVDEGDTSHTDALGKVRGGCCASGCWAFIRPSPEAHGGAGLSADADSALCGRCGRACGEHMLGTDSNAELERWALSSFVVAQAFVYVRGERRVRGIQLGRLSRGDVVRGRVEGDWLRLCADSVRLAIGPAPIGELPAAWVLINGARLGLGELLRPCSA